jgi:hypothetical protein
MCRGGGPQAAAPISWTAGGLVSGKFCRAPQRAQRPKPFRRLVTAVGNGVAGGVSLVLDVVR